MKISPRGLELIKDFEGFSSTSYLCVAKIPTIGFGNTFYEDGRKVKLGEQISKTDALKLLEVVPVSIEEHWSGKASCCTPTNISSNFISKPKYNPYLIPKIINPTVKDIKNAFCQ